MPKALPLGQARQFLMLYSILTAGTFLGRQPSNY